MQGEYINPQLLVRQTFLSAPNPRRLVSRRHSICRGARRAPVARFQPPAF
ncbi:MAG: hypothetical protein OJF49_003729 [Ktedonobacterales bacterium]|nr:MAG: hypothetical protein OJF49_003729 [Ktedonobacterales bacterium]